VVNGSAKTKVILAALTAAALLPFANAARADAAARDELERNKAVVRRVYEEGLSQGRFEVPYTDDFVGHAGAVDFKHADGIAEAKGWRSAFPDLDVHVDLVLAEADLVSVRWTGRTAPPRRSASA
jgi:hypothetical protein